MGAKPIILCIDDDQTILNALNIQLRRKFGKEFNCEFAESAEEGLEIIAELDETGETVVMVVSDQIMPGMTGDEFLVNFHKRDPKPIKVLLTGQAAIDSAINAINNANLFRYLTKPWDEEDLLLTIEKGLQQYFLFDQLDARNKELEQTNDVFRRFVPDELQQRIAKEGIIKLRVDQAVEGMATVLFSDLRSFSTIAENQIPSETLAFLNQMMNPLIPEIHKHEGFINQFVGDSIMAIFYDRENNELEGTNRAVDAAIDMQLALKRTIRKIDSRHAGDLIMGVGLNTGPIVTGLIGNENRMEAAVIGDTVNLASRMENLTKTYKQEIILSDITYRNIVDRERYLIRSVDLVRVYGKSNPVELFEVFNANADDIIEAKSKILPDYNDGIEAFRSGRWGEALAIFNQCKTVLRNDALIDLYIERSRKLLATPPDEAWDGVYQIGKAG